MNLKSTKKKNQVVTANIFEQQELLKKAEVIRKNLTAATGHELETNGKFDKNAKLSFISDDMLILGCDVGSETHYLRAIDTRGRELSKSAYSFSNDSEGFQSAKEWAVELAAKNDKKQIVLGLEPTGYYWFCLATWMIANGISVVQVNHYAVKQTKEVEDNSQLKDETKDPKLIANLVKDGNFGMPYLPEKVYAELRRLSMFRDQLNEDRIRAFNRMHREMKIYFPEAGGILEYAKVSVGIKDGADAGKTAVKWFVQRILELDVELAIIENEINQKCREIPHVENILEISRIGENTLSGILAEMGDISRFDDVKEIQKLSGLGLVACSSGKHKGENKINHRGRKRLRYWLFQAAKSVAAYAEEFKQLHVYYTTRKDNPLKKMQPLIVIVCKILRVIYTILTKGIKYDPKKMLGDIVRPNQQITQAP